MIKRIFWSILSAALAGLALAVAAALGLERGAVLVTAAALLVLAVIFASVVSRRIVKPLRELDIKDPDGASYYRELSPLVGRLTRQRQLIDQQTADLRRGQEELQAITDNMAEGFALVDENMELLSFNSSAERLMEAGTRKLSPVFQETAGRALHGEHSEQTATLSGRVFQVLANPVETGGRVTGAVLVSLDITEKAEREAMRHDFSSNVSHELKTPLTSIYGISELMVNGMVKPEDISAFAKSIHDESGRLITLISDIIRLSQLDDGCVDMERSDVDLSETAKSVAARLGPQAAERGITVSVTGAPVTVFGIPSIIDEMIYNICDNAIKYNVEGGSVRVSTASIGGHGVVSVADTGIGIPPEHIDRVFERFYRVDKSHSKSIGGTGLGLSIVKHGAALHGADVSIKSRTGHGTTVTVTF